MAALSAAVASPLERDLGILQHVGLRSGMLHLQTTGLPAQARTLAVQPAIYSAVQAWFHGADALPARWKAVQTGLRLGEIEDVATGIRELGALLGGILNRGWGAFSDAMHATGLAFAAEEKNLPKNFADLGIWSGDAALGAALDRVAGELRAAASVFRGDPYLVTDVATALGCDASVHSIEDVVSWAEAQHAISCSLSST